MMTSKWNKTYLLNSHNRVDYPPTSVNLTYAWSFGSTAGFCLVILIIDVLIAQHYDIDLIEIAYIGIVYIGTVYIGTDFFISSVGYIMENVNYGWFILYSFFFLLEIYKNSPTFIIPDDFFFFKINLYPYSSPFKEEYFSIFLFLVVAIALSLIIFGLSYTLSVQNPDTEKLSAYECGFDPYEDARHTFDVRFYLVAILFIIFDIEAMFLFPWVVSLSNITSLGFWTMADFIAELGVGFLYAWKIGALEWE